MTGIVLGTCGELGGESGKASRPESGAAERMRRLEKVNAALIARAERITESQADAYALFQAAILLENQVQSRTEELLAAKHRLERSNREISEAKEAAEIANRSKSRFLTAASHDLLQPLNAARLLVSALAEIQGSAKGVQLVGQIDRALVTIGELIKSVLDIAKLDAGVMVPEIGTIGLRDLLGAVAADVAPLAAQKQLRLAVRTPDVAVNSDPILLKRVLANLASNAVRYTKTGGILLGARRRGAFMRIDVVDTGIGIAPEHSAAIFEEFSRGPVQGKEFGEGLGLGLAIVRRMAQTLSHDLFFRSIIGRGSVFSLRVPIAATAATHETGSSLMLPQADHLAGAQLLLIENDQPIVDAMAALAERWQCTLTVAADPETAQALIAEKNFIPQLIIADYHLDNGLCGLDVIDAVRAAAGSEIPAIVATADDSPAVDAMVKAKGLTLLKKPLKPAELRALMMHVLALKNADLLPETGG